MNSPNNIHILPYVPFNFMRNIYNQFNEFTKNNFVDEIHEDQKKTLDDFLIFLQEHKMNLSYFKKYVKEMSPTHPFSITENQNHSKNLLQILNKNNKNNNNNNNINNNTSINVQKLPVISPELKEKMLDFYEILKQHESEIFETIPLPILDKWNHIQKDIYQYIHIHMSQLLSIQDTIFNYLEQLKQWEKWIDNAPINISIEHKEYRMQFLFEIWSKQFTVPQIEQMITTYLHLYNIIQPFYSMYFTIPLSTCSICISNPKKVVLIPCGHTFCQECSNKCKECPICRSNIQSIQIIYL